ncbi:MAG: hypothetical protein AB7F59_07650 [Bdellovibrionales bacterium]
MKLLNLAFSILLGGLSASASVPLNSSILLFHEGDYIRCPQLLRNAIALGNQTINIVPAIGFQADTSKVITAYCLEKTDGLCHKMTPQLANFFALKVKECLSVAKAAKVDIAILPHLDFGHRGQGMPTDRPLSPPIWRNYLSFDPLATYHGFTYEQLMLRPLVESAKELVAAGRSVYLSLQGEMGVSVFQYSSQYTRIYQSYRSQMPSPKFQMGLSFNFNNTNGEFKNFPVNEVQNLFSRVDFIGISAYRGVSVPPQVADFPAIVQSFVTELNQLKVIVPPQKPLHFSEISIGGGDYKQTGKMASSVEELARAPWSGVGGAYNPANDPWQRADFAEFRRRYFKALMDFLRVPAAQYPVVASFIWNAGSWDVQGLYSPSYGDKVIVNAIRAHNAQ